MQACSGCCRYPSGVHWLFGLGILPGKCCREPRVCQWLPTMTDGWACKNVVSEQEVNSRAKRMAVQCCQNRFVGQFQSVFRVCLKAVCHHCSQCCTVGRDLKGNWRFLYHLMWLYVELEVTLNVCRFPRGLWHYLLRYILIKCQICSTQCSSVRWVGILAKLLCWRHLLLSKPLLCAPFFAASLQVDIVPSQGEISVGESKFFLCQGECWLSAWGVCTSGFAGKADLHVRSEIKALLLSQAVRFLAFFLICPQIW